MYDVLLEKKNLKFCQNHVSQEIEVLFSRKLVGFCWSYLYIGIYIEEKI